MVPVELADPLRLLAAVLPDLPQALSASRPPPMAVTVEIPVMAPAVQADRRR